MFKKIFFIKKFDIICHNDKEVTDIQIELFSKDYSWPDGKDIKMGYEYPVIIKNYHEITQFFSPLDNLYQLIIGGSKELFFEDYNFIINDNKYKNINFITASSYIRKIKLSKIKIF